MLHVARSLLLLHADIGFGARVMEAAGNDFAVQVVDCWRTLRERLRKASPAAVAIVDPYAEAEGETGLASQLQVLLTEFPMDPVLAALEARRGGFSDVRTLGEWGIMEIILLDEHDALAIRRLVKAARGRPLKALLDRSLPETTGGRARSILEAAGEVALVGGQATELAHKLDTSERTLLRWCTGAGLPPPRELLAWMRILLAAELLDRPGRSVESVAYACGYASDSGLRRVLRDYLETNPKALRAEGAFDAAAEQFRKVLAVTATKKESTERQATAVS